MIKFDSFQVSLRLNISSFQFFISQDGMTYIGREDANFNPDIGGRFFRIPYIITTY